VGRDGDGQSACVGVGEVASNRAAGFSANDRAARGLVIFERSKIAERSPGNLAKPDRRVNVAIWKVYLGIS